MKLYNRIMELFWLVAGFAVLGFALYLYFNDIETEDLNMYFMAGSMAILLSAFRIIYRKNVVENPDAQKTNRK